MPSQPDFEYSYRWTEGLDAEKLDARDQALEAHMASFGGGCSVIFEYQYRWIDILAADTATQIQMLDANMTALEQAVSATGGCTLEFPFRWSDFWEALKEGESWAVGIAEENDRAIEFRFGRCTCATFNGLSFLFSAGPDGTLTSPTYNLAATITGALAVSHTNYIASGTIELQIFSGGSWITHTTFSGGLDDINSNGPPVSIADIPEGPVRAVFTDMPAGPAGELRITGDPVADPGGVVYVLPNESFLTAFYNFGAGDRATDGVLLSTIGAVDPVFTVEGIQTGSGVGPTPLTVQTSPDNATWTTVGSITLTGGFGSYFYEEQALADIPADTWVRFMYNPNDSGLPNDSPSDFPNSGGFGLRWTGNPFSATLGPSSWISA